jgi:tRNA (adenine37-N6)-methyltransferase
MTNSSESDSAVARIVMHPIGVVRSSRRELKDDDWDQVTARIEIDPTQLDEESLLGLDTFSHVEILFVMNQVKDEAIQKRARHPRNNEAWPKVGILAQRAKMRPNRMGLTVCSIQSLKGLTLHVTGLDALDGSPVLDIKPWVAAFGPRGEVREPSWMTELMSRYW